MKLISAVTACILFTGAAIAQTPQKAGVKKVRKNAVGGTILDARKRAIPKVQVYIYRGDSATNSSGFTDAAGNFETNAVMPGVYDLRIVYPSTKRIIVSGVPVKALKITQISIAANEPVADSAVAYADIAPKPAPKK